MTYTCPCDTDERRSVVAIIDGVGKPMELCPACMLTMDRLKTEVVDQCEERTCDNPVASDGLCGRCYDYAVSVGQIEPKGAVWGTA